MMAWMFFATVCAYFVKGISGFANTLVFSSMMCFCADHVDFTPIDPVIGLPGNLMMVWRERRSIRPRVCVVPVLCAVIGDIPGVLLLRQTDARVLKLIFGGVVVAMGLEMLLHDGKAQKKQTNRLVLIGIALLAGLMCGLFGVGALLAGYFNRISDDASSFRGNLCACFTIEAIFRIGCYFALDLLNVQMIVRVLPLYAAMVLGMCSGMKCSTLMDEKLVRRIIHITLIVSGLSLIVSNF